MSGADPRTNAGGGAQAVFFPVEAEVPESKRHLELRTLLYQFLKLAFSERAAIGCDQFVYWDPSDPRACLAPDAFVRFGEVNDLFRCWKVWERGAPQVAVEIISDSDEGTREWDEKLKRYRRLGIAELVRFDPESIDRPLRVWDLVGQELLERKLSESCAASRYLGGFWLAVPDPTCGVALRLSYDEQGRHLFPTPTERESQGRRAEAKARQAEAKAHQAEAEARQAEAEARQAEAEARRAEAEGRQQAEAEGRRAAEQRVLELEAELRRRRP